MCNAKNFGLIWQASQILINEQLDAQMYSAPNYTAPELAELLKALLDQNVEFCENFLRSIGDRSSYGCLLALKKLSMKRQIKLLPMFNIVSFSHYSMSACAGVLQNWSPKNRQQFLQIIDSDGLHALFRRIITDESKKNATKRSFECGTRRCIESPWHNNKNGLPDMGGKIRAKAARTR